MSEPFYGEIRMFGGNFAPRGWAKCDGQLLAISQNDALFSLLGTFYGGDGRTTFGLPDLRGRIPIHNGSGPGLSTRRLGEKGGVEQVVLTPAELPPHGHDLQASKQSATSASAADNVFARSVGDVYTPDLDPMPLHANVISMAGGSQPHGNVMPFTCVTFIIALIGIYPSRS